MTDIAQKLRDLADEIEHETKSEPAQPWPPKGVSIDIYVAGIWCPRVSAGGGLIYTPYGGRSLLHHFRWRYAPASWDIAPYRAKSWFVTSDSETGWSVHEEEVGKEWRFGKFVHVEYRPETEEAQQ